LLLGYQFDASGIKGGALGAWTMAFSNGYGSNFVYKVYNYQVRAVRAF
jgi:hypothetical protein